jgi:hypothetical protein
MRMKNAALFALGFLSVSFWLHDSARCQTSLAPPLSLAPPPALTDRGSAAPATTNSVWPLMATPNVSPPRATAKGSAPSATTNVWPPSATDGVPPPTATAKRSVPPVTAKDAPRPAIATEAPPTATVKDMPPTAPAKRLAPSATAKDAPPPAIAADALPTATVKDTPPTAPDDVSSPPAPKPAADYDGFSIGIVDDRDTSGQTTRPVRPRPTKQSKLSQEPDSIEGQQSVDQAEDEKLKRKLTICRGCK